VGGHVTLRSGVGVVPPRAADLRGPLEHHHVVAAGALQQVGEADAGEAGADDGDAVVGNVGTCAAVRRTGLV
jgi:hypothetical protein